MKTFIFITLSMLSGSMGMYAQVATEMIVPSSCNQLASFDIEVTLDKLNLDGVGKVELVIPEGLQLESILENAESVFIQRENIFKFLWKQLPEENALTLRIKMRALESARGEMLISGRFQYMDNNVAQELEIPEKTISVTALAVMDVDGAVNSTEIKKSEPNQVGTVSSEVQGSVNTIDEANMEPGSDSQVVESDFEKSTTENTAPKVLFHVQIMSSKTSWEIEKVKKKFRINREVFSLKQGEIHKYLIGQFDNYADGKSLVSKLKTSGEISDCFVVASFDGAIISMNEARAKSN